MRDIADDSTDSSDNEPQDVFTYNDVLDGNVRIEISHAGGELDDLQDNLNQELNGKKQQSFRRRRDTRKRWDTVDRRVLGFRGQMCAMTDAYIKWEATQGAFGMEGALEPVVDPEDVEREYRVEVINVFARVLELYCVARLRCPNLSVQSWVKTLSDVQARAFKPYQVQQFTICFDLYLEILQNVDAQVKKALDVMARLAVKNCCPACTYKLEGEDKLIFEMLATCDGNDSLKRVLRKEQGVFDDNGAGGDYYLTRERVNRWSKEMLAQQAQVPRSDDQEEDGQCQERWKNMSEEITARMWGIFDETGIFLSLCRHGFVLLIADMVKSGELVYLRKQAIATYAAHVDTFETYTNLSTFLVKNYEQSLAILETETSLHFAMAQAGISGKDEFVRRLEEERTYLRGLSKEPEAETQQMDYYQRLVNLEARKRYRLCVNKLEDLVLKRLFELTKMNMSQTGYKLRKHIAKALQVRSKTIRAALARYNLAAGSLTPKHRKLTWAEVVEYAFLSDFDILRDPTGNAALRDWATQGGRQLMDSFFRIERAKEEIPRLNIEIRRLITYIRDERICLLAKEAEIIQTDPHLAHFIRKSMKKKLGSSYTGTLEPGVRRAEAAECDVEEEMDVDSDVDKAEAAAVEAEIARGRAMELNGQVEEEWEDVDSNEDDEGEVVEGETLAEMAEQVFTIATDA
ncbi:hypothetical protein B0H17DRAFT_1146362 [Mycena rosella]|uniref:Uncharacterized protein n=1 Tax=Mycena rosella TaxID=1033263 RepID=A0AAD7CP07_MYCRO|nr:hypothetical protein B0H17DRAFT_1146362 [Mycena rosella]